MDPYYDNKRRSPQTYGTHICTSMGDLSGGQMIAKRVPVVLSFHQFDEDVDVLKDKNSTRLDDSMAEEAKICFNFCHRAF